MIMITSLYAALLICLLLFIAVKTIVIRKRELIALGDGQNQALIRCNRAQGNLCEYAPFFLIGLSILEINGLAYWVIHALGLVFVCGRILHAYSMLNHERYSEDYKIQGFPRFRFIGMICTLSTLLVMVFILMGQFLVTL